jgi:hypothetical protein
MVQWLNPLISAQVETERMEVQGKCGQKAQRTILTNKKLGEAAHSCHPSYERSKNIRIIVQTALGIKARPYLKYSQSKKSEKCGSSGRASA